jgi:quercetin dioxygenase-like cupin family protein
MKRRSFLQTAAALLPAAALQDLALAQATVAPPSDPIHVVGAGQDRFGEPHSRGFSQILFKVPTRETAGGLFIIEHADLVKGGPPFHIHVYQEEWFYVIEGDVIFQIGEDRKRLGPGESVLAPRNIPHAFAAQGPKPGRMLIAFTPAGKMEEFFRATAIPNPPIQDAAFFRRYEMKLIGPSPFES